MKTTPKLMLALLLSLALLASACGGGDDEANNNTGADTSANEATTPDDDESSQDSADASTDGLLFGASYFSLSNPHFQNWSDGLSSVIEANGGELVDVDAQNDINKQIGDIDALIQQGVSALFIAPADSAGIRPALIAAQEAGIPVIMIDIGAEDEELVSATVTTNNFSAGVVLAEALVANFDGDAKVAHIDWDVVQAVTDRNDGFNSVIADYPDIEVVTAQQADAPDADNGLVVMENMLQSNPEVEAVYAINDPLCAGARSALQAGDRLDVELYCIDGSELGVTSTCAGEFVGTSAQVPFDMGVTAATQAFELISGQEVPALTQVDSFWINESNCSEYLP